MKSIRHRLTVWLLGGLAVLCIAAGAGIYVTVRDSLLKTLDAELTVHLIDGFMLTAGETFEIIDIAGVLTGTFAGLPEGALVDTEGLLDLQITYACGDGNDIVLTAVIPEPATLALLGLAACAMTLAVRRPGR